MVVEQVQVNYLQVSCRQRGTQSSVAENKHPVTDSNYPPAQERVCGIRQRRRGSHSRLGVCVGGGAVPAGPAAAVVVAVEGAVAGLAVGLGVEALPTWLEVELVDEEPAPSAALQTEGSELRNSHLHTRLGVRVQIRVRDAQIRVWDAQIRVQDAQIREHAALIHNTEERCH